MTTPDNAPPPNADPDLSRAYLAEFDRQVRRLWLRVQDKYLSVVDREDVVASAIGSLVRAGKVPTDGAGWVSIRGLLSTAVDRKLCNKIRYFSTAIRDVGRNAGPAAELDPGREQSPDGAAVAAELLHNLVTGLDALEWRVLGMLEAGYTVPEIAAATGSHTRKVYRIVETLKKRARRSQEQSAGPDESH